MFIYEKNIKGVDNSECPIILSNDSNVLFFKFRMNRLDQYAF
jgi:hypothetical protein